MPSATAQPAETCDAWNETLWVVGLPNLNEGRGGIEVTSANGRTIITAASLDLVASARGDHFGAAVTSLSADDGDDCDDVAVGAPGAQGTGAVYVLHGSPSGLRGGYQVRLMKAAAGDRFGASISSHNSVPVVAGAPGRDIAGVADAGAIAWFTAGADAPTAPPVEISQASTYVAGSPEPNDRFGEVLTAPFDNALDGVDVFVGVPHEDIGTRRDAGIVELITLNLGNFEDPAGRVFRQGRGDVRFGRAEAGDLFGSALANSEDGLAIGVPGEDVGSVSDAGAVNFLHSFFQASPEDGPIYIDYEPAGVVSQNSPRVPGRAEAGDQFGASVVALGQLCPDIFHPTFAIGAPGEDLHGITDAGTVTLLEAELLGDPSRPCPSRIVRQGGLASGHAERGDHFGAGATSKRNGDLAVWAPGEDLGSANDAGLITFTTFPALARAGSQTLLGGPQPGLRYATLPRYESSLSDG